MGDKVAEKAQALAFAVLSEFKNHTAECVDLINLHLNAVGLHVTVLDGRGGCEKCPDCGKCGPCGYCDCKR